MEWATIAPKQRNINISGILSFIDDTFVFLEISYKLAQNAHNESTCGAIWRISFQPSPNFCCWTANSITCRCSLSNFWKFAYFFMERLTVLTNFIAILTKFWWFSFHYRLFTGLSGRSLITWRWTWWHVAFIVAPSLASTKHPPMSTSNIFVRIHPSCVSPAHNNW